MHDMTSNPNSCEVQNVKSTEMEVSAVHGNLHGNLHGNFLVRVGLDAGCHLQVSVRL